MSSTAKALLSFDTTHAPAANTVASLYSMCNITHIYTHKHIISADQHSSGVLSVETKCSDCRYGGSEVRLECEVRKTTTACECKLQFQCEQVLLVN